MKIFDRATRGTAARVIWGGLAVLFLLGFFLSRAQKGTALNDQVQQAQTRVESDARTTIADQAIVDTRADTITFDKKNVAVAIEGDIFTDPTVARLRVWDKDGLLLASSDPSEVVGQLKVAQDATFANALAGTTGSQVVEENFTFATVGSPAAPTQLLEVSTPFMVKDQVDPVGVVQMDVFYAQLTAAAAKPWTTLVLICLIGAVIAGLLFVLAMVRKPKTAADVAPPVERGSIEPTPMTAPTSAAAPGRDQELEEELKVAREQLQQATEAFAFMELQVKDSRDGQASAAEIEAAAGRIAELEAALKRAEADTAAARIRALSRDEHDELERARRDADERVAELVRLRESDATKVDPEMEALRAQLAAAEARAKGAEDALAAARSDVASTHEEIEETSNGHVSNDLIDELEAKVAKAEARAKEAEEQALRVTPEANDLRSRLTQAAARKKLGPSG